MRIWCRAARRVTRRWHGRRGGHEPMLSAADAGRSSGDAGRCVTRLLRDRRLLAPPALAAASHGSRPRERLRRSPHWRTRPLFRFEPRRPAAMADRVHAPVGCARSSGARAWGAGLSGLRRFALMDRRPRQCRTPVVASPDSSPIARDGLTSSYRRQATSRLRSDAAGAWPFGAAGRGALHFTPPAPACRSTKLDPRRRAATSPGPSPAPVRGKLSLTSPGAQGHAAPRWCIRCFVVFRRATWPERLLLPSSASAPAEGARLRPGRGWAAARAALTPPACTRRCPDRVPGGAGYGVLPDAQF